MIVENKYTNELLEIFDGNSQDYIVDRLAVTRGFLNVVYVEEDIPLGYAVVYFGTDFCEQEEYPIKLENVKENSIYIWQMVTKKGFEGKGIGTCLLKYITEKYYDRDIYSSINVRNLGSLKIHEKCGFIEVANFKKENEKYRMFKIGG
ncbi:MAG: GNAT family N-acetyltransferase [Oscillospiraceae bacterium]|nr:GNAT family N-acetyltransferase [Oscillospiraceae bacterium]